MLRGRRKQNIQKPTSLEITIGEEIDTEAPLEAIETTTVGGEIAEKEMVIGEAASDTLEGETLETMEEENQETLETMEEENPEVVIETEMLGVMETIEMDIKKDKERDLDLCQERRQSLGGRRGLLLENRTNLDRYITFITLLMMIT